MGGTLNGQRSLTVIEGVMPGRSYGGALNGQRSLTVIGSVMAKRSVFAERPVRNTLLPHPAATLLFWTEISHFCFGQRCHINGQRSLTVIGSVMPKRSCGGTLNGQRSLTVIESVMPKRSCGGST